MMLSATQTTHAECYRGVSCPTVDYHSLFTDRVPQRVLLVDDDQDTLAILRELFASDGYEVACATDGRQALHHLRDHPNTDLIVLDLVMPRYDGYHFLSERSRSPGLCQIPVLVTTGSSTLKDLIEVDAVLRKPMDLNSLMDAVCYTRSRAFH